MTPCSGSPAAGTSSAPAIPPVLAEVVRSGFVEGHHRGSLVLLAADGGVELALGDVTAPVFPRSSNKPMQAAAVLRAGLDLSGERLALAAASHSGEEFHRDLVQKMLAEHGLTAGQLQCPADLPLDPAEAETYLAAGRVREPVTMNCSGKHAAMLAACGLNEWSQETYLDPDHPLQRLVLSVVEEAAGESVAAVGTDGCGAPLMAISLTGLARAFRHFVLAPEGSAERRVADAMRAHPEYVAGTRRPDTWLMREVPGALSKMGAEAVQAVALPDGRALAFKVEDGATRALGPVLARALALAGVEAPVLTRIGHAPLWGGGREVGAVRAAF
ncbi:asparaginase [Streptomyces sp. PSKA54]|uniref:Asparaginase n=1 Tax=Streptomyces himalayensis subsp. aureolus TaxID=2758039 RepID=A0A7W2D6B9_9ACTN|nr:asparaginase [Streptomyces himalayensis]MBA4865596.1 asparaginase [Streptomyces himalayensis subsp. aureolus]